MMVTKKSFAVIVCCVCLISVVCFVLSDYVIAQSDMGGKKNAAVETQIIKIPPPLEGMILPESQTLNKIKIAILSADKKLHKYVVEVARTPEEQRIGLMYRKYIDENTGMLFAFKEEVNRSFWMKNTLIPLDILFIRRDGVINYIHHMAEEKSLKRISSNGKAMAVLEIAGGEAEILGINVGDRILYKDF